MLKHELQQGPEDAAVQSGGPDSQPDRILFKSVAHSADTRRMRCICGLILLCIPAMAALWTGCATPEPACCRATHRDGTQCFLNVSTNAIIDLQAPWQNDDGQEIRLSALHGRPVIISMFYAACEGVCVITKDDLKAVQASLPSAIAARTAFVLVTLDPAHDSAVALKKYRLAQGLAAGRWWLLRGSEQDTGRLAAALGIGFGRDQAGLLRHSSQLVVLDGAGQIVARQDGIHANLDEVVHALTLAAQP